MSRATRPPAGARADAVSAIDASGPEIPVAKMKRASAPQKLRDVPVTKPDLTRWGAATPAEHDAAVSALFDLDDVLKGGPVTDHAGTHARALFESAAEINPVALIRVALDSIAPDGVNDPARLALNYANILATAVEVFGEPEAPALMRDYTHAGNVPGWIYDDLPGPLARLARCYKPGPPRDTFLVAALGCVNAALPNVAFRYAQKWSRCNLFLAVIAESGAGKAPLIAAGRLLRPINRHLLKVSDGEIARWNRAQKSDAPLIDGDVSIESPPSRYVSFGGDIADAEFFLATHANGGHGAIIESEIATLLATMGKEWGNFRPKLLKGFENEEMTYARTRRRPLMIAHPEITLVTSGTPAAFAEWISDNEDGLFNRTGFYTFPGSLEWRSGWDRSDDAAGEMEEANDYLAGILLRAYSQLTTTRTNPKDDAGKEQVPLYAVFADDQKERLDAAFSAQKSSLAALGLAPLANYTHRTALLALRIAAGLSALRLSCQKADLGSPLKSFHVTEPDFRVGLQMGLLLMAHGVELARRHFRGVESAPVTGPVKEKRTPRARFLDEIGREFGAASFMRGEAVVLIDRVGKSTRTGDNYLAGLVAEGYLALISEGPQGLYSRTDKAPPVREVVAVQAAAPEPIGFVPRELLFPPGQDGAMGEVSVVVTQAAPAAAEAPHPDHAEALGDSHSPAGEPDKF